MNFDMSIFNELALPLVVAACLVLGYIIKKWVKDVDNKYIPTILAAVGVVLACLVKMGHQRGNRGMRGVFRPCEHRPAPDV